MASVASRVRAMNLLGPNPPHPAPFPAEVGFIRFRHLIVLNSGKPEFSGEREKMSRKA